jgi:hypothetical protein
MSKAVRKASPTETNQLSPATLLEGLNVKSSGTLLVRKTKKDGSPTWDQTHAPFRYDLTDPEVYYAVAGIATSLGINNISTVAAQLMDFALTMYDRGQIRMEARPNPNPYSTRMVLTWEKADGWAREIKPDRERKQRQRKLIAPERKRTPFGFRWGRDTHNRLKVLAESYSVPLGALVTRLLAYAIDEYRNGHLRLDLHHVALRDVSGWSAG